MGGLLSCSAPFNYDQAQSMNEYLGDFVTNLILHAKRLCTKCIGEFIPEKLILKAKSGDHYKTMGSHCCLSSLRPSQIAAFTLRSCNTHLHGRLLVVCFAQLKPR